MPTLHIMNPETDYALASGRRYYTAPAHVAAIRRRLALLPRQWACPGDAILLPDAEDRQTYPEEELKECRGKEIETVDIREIRTRKDILEEYGISPWGWNMSLRQQLIDAGFPPERLPAESRIQRLRELSHRRTSISFLKAMPAELIAGVALPEEIEDVDIAMQAYLDDKRRYFKAPWSSSGRGILLTDDLEPRHVRPWLEGIVRRQGSVIMEKAYNRTMDFATEWMCRDRQCHFIGFSIFNVSRRGKYHGNMAASQEELHRHIADRIGKDPGDILLGQKAAAEKVICPGYEGPMGIDMLLTDEGIVNPCVELNLRLTMGIVEILRQKNVATGV